jgi:hypothetical protein
MLLQCDICQLKLTACAKVPCGFYIEKQDDGTILFVMPTDETAYRDICLDCLSTM